MKLDLLVSRHHPHAFIKVSENFHYMVISTAWNFEIPIEISLLLWVIF